MPNQYKKITIEDCRNLAKSKNGECLSETYINAQIPLLWKCEFNHEFTLAWKHIQYYKLWCNQCNSNISEEICRIYFETIFNEKFPRTRPVWLKYQKYNLELDGYSAELGIAFEHNGTQHSEKHPYFHDDASDLNKQIQRDQFKMEKCKQLGVKLIIIPELFAELKLASLLNFLKSEFKKLNIHIPKDIDTISFDLTNVNKADNKLDYYKSLAQAKGGECLSDTYIQFHDPLTWKCSEGHIWKTPGYSIEYGTWCKICAGYQKLTIEDARDIAKQKNGECLSTIYIPGEKLKWKCGAGHIWEAIFGSIRNHGSWCKKCYLITRSNKEINE